MDPRRELQAWLTLLGTVGRGTARKLLLRHGSPEAVLAEAALPAPKAPLEPILAQTWAWLDGGPQRSVLRLGDPDYPAGLLAAPDAPLLLFLEGDRTQLGRPAVAIVGSRNATPQGVELAERFAAELAALDWVVVSGLALGIDGAAHRGALRAGGSTWAVLGNGLDAPYPTRHRGLADDIRRSGLLLSEHAPGTPPLPAHFPARNRVIAGLSHGCLVVEAALQSGSLITARLALEAGREVFAVPGPIRSPQSQGCNALIQQGAQLVQSAAEIDAILAPQRPRSAAPTPAASPAREAALEDDPLLVALGWEPSSFDALQTRLGWRTDALSARLLELELLGLVRTLPGARFERT
ncbi:DNA-processing protein DprA [Inhella crocodyli]|uniref:DNA-protecting protein DprA n=1 Tax=Inhella crocodyli TaxID=2499851 RepID=A0A3S2UFT7_9BURK|nr:DNA-processing protein DprA [Inhella crocodyli]RVT84695.1 DNA-protecting protein DprA [Inhella crocodyli]